MLQENALQHGGRCQLDVGRWCVRHGRPCAGVCTSGAQVVHHTKGKQATGDDLRYLIAACTTCNQHVGQPVTDPAPRPRTVWV